MEKLPIGVGILAWKSGQTLVDTLVTYHESGLLNVVGKTVILFQEFSEEDKLIAEHFDIEYIPLHDNIGIGYGFIRLAQYINQPYFLTLEHDWKLIENMLTTYNRLQSGIQLIENGVDAVRYRHRTNPGYPHFSFRHQGNELTYYDEEIGCTSPHLLDAIHWTERPDEKFAPYIQKENDYYITTSRYGNWTNNPCMYRTKFYIDTVTPFMGDKIALEGNISKWWAQQSFKVAHGEGLFTHVDLRKYGK